MSAGRAAVTGSTRARTIAAALDLFGSRGVDAVSLDEIAGVGRRAQADRALLVRDRRTSSSTRCSPMPSRELVVTDRRGRARRARRSARPHRLPWCVAVFRAAVRTPAILGLIREVSRLPESRAATSCAARCNRSSTAPSPTSPSRWTPGGCAAATRASSPCSGYATVTGIATDPEALRAVGWQPDAAGCAGSAPSCAHSSAPPSRPDPAGERRAQGARAASGARQCLVLRRRWAWRSSARSTRRSISSG